MNEINRKLNAVTEWEKMQEALKEAKALLEKEMPSGSISRAYYAAFHAGKALLLTEGVEIRSHQALGRFFSLHFVKTGRFDVQFSRILSKAQKYREEADYNSEFVFRMEDAHERFREVSEFIKVIEAHLKKEGYLK